MIYILKVILKLNKKYNKTNINLLLILNVTIIKNYFYSKIFTISEIIIQNNSILQ